MERLALIIVNCGTPAVHALGVKILLAQRIDHLIDLIVTEVIHFKHRPKVAAIVADDKHGTITVGFPFVLPLLRSVEGAATAS